MTKLLVLFVTAFVDMVGLAMVLPLLPYYATSLGVGATAVGLLVSSFSLAQLVCAPAWGRFSDRYGRRPAIILGLAVTALAYVLFGLADSIWLLFLSRVVQGVGGGTIGVVQAYVADASPPEARTRSLGWLSAVASLGAVAGPALGSALVAVGGRQAPGFGAAALAGLVAVFAWRCLKEARITGTTTEHPIAAASTGGSVIGKVLTDWRDPASRLIWTYTVAIGAFYGTVPIMPLLLSKRLGITEHTIGYVIMYLGGMGVVVRTLLLGRAVDRLGEKRLSRLGIGLLATGLALFGCTTSYGTLVLSLTMMPLGTAFLFPCVSGQLSQVISRRERGLYMGVQHAFGGASRVVFPIAVGLAMDGLGMGLPFIVAGALVVMTLPLTWPARPIASRPVGLRISEPSQITLH